MPRGDRRGPEGTGPMTGRGLGYCAGNDRPGFAVNAAPQGLGKGFRGGAGRRFAVGRGRGMGYGRGYGYAVMNNQAPVQQSTTQETVQEDQAASQQNQINRLANIAENLQNQLSEIQNEINELKSE